MTQPDDLCLKVRQKEEKRRLHDQRKVNLITSLNYHFTEVTGGQQNILVIPQGCAALSSQSCPTLCDLMDCSPPGSSVHGDSPGKITGVGCHALLQETFPTQGSNPGLLQGRQILYHLSHQQSHVTSQIENVENMTRQTYFYRWKWLELSNQKQCDLVWILFNKSNHLKCHWGDKITILTLFTSSSFSSGFHLLQTTVTVKA